MAQQIINIGSSENKGDGDPLRTAFQKINDNFNEMYDNFDSGSYVFKGVFDGDLLGSVFSDTSLTLIDGQNGDVKYYPNNVSDWHGTPPVSVGEALDRIAAAIKAINTTGP